MAIPQSSSITGASPSDCLVSYPDTHWGNLTPLQGCSQCILQPQLTKPVIGCVLALDNLLSSSFSIN